MKKHRDIKLVTTERRRNYLVSEPNYHTTKCFAQNLLAMETKKTEILMNKLVYLGLPILEVSKILMYEFWYDYEELRYGEKAKICSMNTNSFIVYIKADDTYKDIVEDVETSFDTSNYELNRPLSKGKKVTGLMKDELGEKIITKFVGLRATTYSYTIDDSSEDKNAKGTKNCVIKRKLKSENYKNYLEATQL